MKTPLTEMNLPKGKILEISKMIIEKLKDNKHMFTKQELKLNTN